MSQPAFLIAVASIQNLGFNLVHPVTPAFISAQGMQDWIFGVAYAAMALTSFLFSKMAGGLCARFEARGVFCVGCLGYAAAQLLFLWSSTEAQVIVCRLLSGPFVALINVASLVYLVRASSPARRARNLTALATATAVTTALGYTLGGLVGNDSYERAFLVQAALLAADGVLVAAAGRAWGTRGMGLGRILRDANPLSLGFEGFRITRAGAFALGVALVSLAALTTYEQALNYYLKDALGYAPADIGLLKGAIGMVTLAANQIVAVRVMRRGHLTRSVGVVFALACATNAALVAFGTGSAFVVCNLAFTVFNAMHLPMVQELVTASDASHQGELVSLYNEMRSIGWVVGGLVAGGAYALWPQLPFAITCALFLGLGASCLSRGDAKQG